VKTNPVTQKVSWRLGELPPATGLSLAFWRKMVRLKKIRHRKVEGALIILDEDLREFLAGTSQNNKAQNQTESLVGAA